MLTARRALLGAGLSGALSLPLSNRAAAAPHADRGPGAPGETDLLHTRLDLGGVRGYEREHRTWRPFAWGRERLLIVHLWALECPPCLAEMPLLRALVRGWRDQAAARFLFISESLDELKVLAFWLTTHREKVPEVAVQQSTDGRIRDALGIGTLPLTLLVDRERLVRQAFIGSLASRKFELGRAIGRLLAGLT